MAAVPGQVEPRDGRIAGNTDRREGRIDHAGVGVRD